MTGEEHALPSQAGPETEGWLAARMARLEFRVQGWVARVIEAVDELKSHLSERGPEDYARDDFERGFKAGLGRNSPWSMGNGSINHHGMSKITAWVLGLFGIVISILLGFVLNAVYSNNGDVRELKGQVNALQIQVTHLAEGRSGVSRGSSDSFP